MVSSGTVHSDESAFVNAMNQYSAEITGLAGSWQGSSYDNITQKAEAFSSEALSTVKGQMDSFAEACDLYVEYEKCKSALSVAEGNYNLAVSNKKSSLISQYGNEIATLQSKLNQLKQQIESCLGAAGGGSISTSGSNAGAKAGDALAQGELTSEQIAQMIEAGKSQIGSDYNSMNYGPKKADGSKGSGFGCAMFVSYCYNNVLFNGVSGQDKGLGGFYGSCKNYWGNVTTDGFDAYNKGFVEVSASEAKPGDIVCFVDNEYTSDPHGDARNCYHVGLYTGNGNMIHSSKFVTSGVGECKITDYTSVRGRGNGVYYLHYVGTGATATPITSEEEQKEEKEEV